MGSEPSARRPWGPTAPRRFAGTPWVPALAARCKHGPGPGPAPAPVRLARSPGAGKTAPFGGHPSPVRGPPGLLARLPSLLWCAAGPPSPPPWAWGVVAVGPCSATPRSAVPARGLVPRPRPGLARRAWPPVGLPRRCPPRLLRSPPCGLVPAASGVCARVPAPAGPPSAPVRAPSGRPSSAPAGLPSSGPPAGSPPPAASACRAGSRPSGGRFGRPPPPRGVGGPPVPRVGGAGAPSVWRSAPGLLRCGAGAPAGAACSSSGCCLSGVSPLPPPRSPSPAGGGGGRRARRVASPPKGSAFRGPLWAPPAPSGRCPAGAAPRR